ncbi:MAG: vWA domain-containing protein [Acidimicrobiales bacterium]
MRTGVSLVLLSTVASQLVSPTGHAAAAPGTPRPPILILVDVSNSMAEDDGQGTQKMAGARTAILSLVASLPSNAAVGLQEYPGSGNCSAGRVLVPVGRDNLERLDLETHSLVPDGDGTPTGPALRHAADNLLLSGNRGSIILISDGESNCGEDPCSVTADLVGENVNVTVNTVGCRVSANGQRELKCIADAGNGAYAEVGSATEFARELERQSGPTLSLNAQDSDEGSVEIVVDLRVSGTQPAPDVVVQAHSTLLADVQNGTRRLGNLSSGADQRLQWTYSTNEVVETPTVLEVTVTASSSGVRLATTKWRTTLTRSSTDQRRPVNDAAMMVNEVQDAATGIEASCRGNRDNRNWFGRTWHWLSRNDLENCMNDAWVREIAHRFAGLDPGRFALPDGTFEGPFREPPPEEIRGSRGWKPELINGDESPARHFLGWLAVGYFHPRIANSGLSEQESSGVPGASQRDLISSAGHRHRH